MFGKKNMNMSECLLSSCLSFLSYSAVSEFGFPRDLPVLNSSAQGNGKNEEGGLENGKKFGGGGKRFHYHKDS